MSAEILGRAADLMLDRAESSPATSATPRFHEDPVVLVAMASWLDSVAVRLDHGGLIQSTDLNAAIVIACAYLGEVTP